MVVTIFKERLRQDADVAAYAALSRRMHERVAAHPGFISIESYSSDSGYSVSIEKFEDMTSLQAWRRDPQHVEAQRRGRAEFYAEYSYDTCEVLHDGSWAVKTHERSHSEVT